MKVRLNKYIANCGVCARRKADELIRQGKVKVNGKTVVDLATKVDIDKDVVEVEDRLLDYKKRKEDKIYIALYKPRGYVSTTRKYKNEKNVLDLVDTDERLYPAGRLDKDSEGLIILTNDGEYANLITHPRYEHEKEYIVWINKPLKNQDILRVQKGIEVGGISYPVKRIKKISPRKINIILTQGKKRHIRVIFKYLGYQVERLLRVRIDNIRLGKLMPGQWRKISL